MLELSHRERRGLTHSGVVLELGSEVVGKSVVIQRDTYVRDDGRLMYLDNVTVGDEAPLIAGICNQPEWAEIQKAMLRCREYDFPWLRSNWGS